MELCTEDLTEQGHNQNFESIESLDNIYVFLQVSIAPVVHVIILYS